MVVSSNQPETPRLQVSLDAVLGRRFDTSTMLEVGPYSTWEAQNTDGQWRRFGECAQRPTNEMSFKERLTEANVAGIVPHSSTSKLNFVTFFMISQLFWAGSALAGQPDFAQPQTAEGGRGIEIRAARGPVSLEGWDGKIGGAYYYDQEFFSESGARQAQTAPLLPPVWHVERGELLQFHLSNNIQLPGAGKPTSGDCDNARTNLHTHGLLVAPWRSAESPFGGKLGDYVLLDVYPGACQDSMAPGHHGTTAHEAAFGAAEYAILVPKEHPSGLFWYHPHAHMLSRRQVGGGMGGLIAAGSVWDNAFIYCDLSRRRACTRSGRKREADARQTLKEGIFFTLKDMQLTPETTGDLKWNFVEDPDPGLCADSDQPMSERLGFCRPKIGDGRWVFPVNGQIHPKIEVSPAGQIWRIGNTSPDVTYRLALQAPAGQQLCMQLLSRDGVAIAQGSDPSADSRVFESDIILMPASRVELFISQADALEKKRTVRGGVCGAEKAPGGAVAAELVTLGFDTGSNRPGEPSPTGDQWPAVQLASVSFGQPAASPLRLQVAQGVVQVAPGSSSGQQADQPATAALNTVRNRLLLDKITLANTLASLRSDRPAPSAMTRKGRCGPDRQGVMDAFDADPESGQVRVVWFAVDNKGSAIPPDAPDRDPKRASDMLTRTGPGFLIANEIRDAGGQRIWPAAEVVLHDFNDTLNTAAQTDICVHAGHREIWRVVNLSDETHNFHIHQSKFRVLSVADPFNQLSREAPWALSPDAIHDVFPVPKFGYIEVEVGFGVGSKQDVVGGLRYGDELKSRNTPSAVQVGRFVFHCHILEHEDGGMMGTIEVLSSPGQDATASSH